MALNLAAVVVFGVSILLRLDATAFALLPMILSALGVILINVSGYLGGVMDYDDGIGVGRHRRRHDVRETQKVTATLDDGFVPILDADALPDNTPRRVEANGYLMVLVRVGGEVHAV